MAPDRCEKFLPLVCCQLTVFLACIAGTVWAQAPFAPRYPWDTRPPACLSEPRASAPDCQLDSWPTWDATVTRLKALYQTEQFSILEQALSETVSSDKRFSWGGSPASAASSMFYYILPAPGVKPEEKDRIARWRAAVPRSYFVVLAEARYVYGTAWNARGQGAASSVSKESWELFSMRLREAEQVLLKAPQPLKETPLWHYLLITIASDGRLQTDPQEAFERAVKLWPDFYDFYHLRLTRLVPKWGGSWEEVDAFISYWTEKQAKKEGTSLYARLYVGLLKDWITPDQTRMDWIKMKQSFVDLIARYPDAGYKNLYASYACFAQDKDTFGEAMRDLPPNVLAPAKWLPGHSLEACLRWAGT